MRCRQIGGPSAAAFCLGQRPLGDDVGSVFVQLASARGGASAPSDGAGSAAPAPSRCLCCCCSGGVGAAPSAGSTAVSAIGTYLSSICSKRMTRSTCERWRESGWFGTHRCTTCSSKSSVKPGKTQWNPVKPTKNQFNSVKSGKTRLGSVLFRLPIRTVGGHNIL